MANKFFITTGSKAQSFYDPTTGICVVKGQEVELNAYQQRAPRIVNALNSGHLIRVNKELEDEVKQYTDKEVEASIKKAKKLHKDGATFEKIASTFNQELIMLMASKSGVTPEEGDTNEDIIEAILTD